MSRKHVYNKFQINIIVFFTFNILLVPILCLIAYLFDLQNFVSPVSIVLISLLICVISLILSVLMLLLLKEKLQKRLKPSYNSEFSFLLIIGLFGTLGLGILFNFLGGHPSYLPHVVIPVFITLYLILLYVGDRYFNINLLRK